jgi:hypothetical protein
MGRVSAAVAAANFLFGTGHTVTETGRLMRLTRRSGAAFVAIGTFVGMLFPAYASPVTYNFAASIQFGILPAGFFAGEQITGQFTLEQTTAPNGTISEGQVYYAAVTAIQMTVGGSPVTFIDPVYLTVFKAGTDGLIADGFTVTQYNGHGPVVTGSNLNGHSGIITINFGAPAGTAIDDPNHLPASFDLAKLHGQNVIVNFGDGASDDQFFYASISEASISAASISQTPLPAALQLFATGLGLLGFAARRRKKRPTTATSALQG